MIRKASLIGFGALLAASAFALGATDSLNLQFSPKEGDNFNYKFTGTLNLGGESAQFSADIHYKVTKVDIDRTYTVLSSQTNMMALLGGQTLTSPDSSSTTVNKLNGE